MRTAIGAVIVGVVVVLAWSACNRKQPIGEPEARRLAQTAAEGFARKVGISPDTVVLENFDDSGKVVRWFYSFASSASREFTVAVLMDKYGRYEMHHQMVRDR